MIPIELKKRYPHSREEDITDAFMRGYQACADAVQGGDAEMDNCQVQAPQNYMQQSRHNDGTDLISRADAIKAVEQEYRIDRGYMVDDYTYGFNQAIDYVSDIILPDLPSADAVSREALNNVKFVAIKGDKVEEAYRSGWNGAIECIIENAPSAEAVQGWIPCSERVPKENEYVDNVCKYYLIQDEYGDMHVAHLSGRGWETIESIKALGCDVIAWMPLPKPYKGGDDE